MVDDRDRLAEILDLVELVAGQQDATSRARLFDEDTSDRVDARRVQPGQGLVQDEKLWSVHERGCQLHPLLVAVRERLHLARVAVRHAEAVQPCPGGGQGVGPAHAVQPA